LTTILNNPVFRYIPSGEEYTHFFYDSNNSATINVSPATYSNTALLSDATKSCLFIGGPNAQSLTQDVVTDIDWSASQANVQKDITSSDNINYQVTESGLYLIQPFLMYIATLADRSSNMECWIVRNNESM
jgi:hypothetical protein